MPKAAHVAHQVAISQSLLSSLGSPKTSMCRTFRLISWLFGHRVSWLFWMQSPPPILHQEPIRQKMSELLSWGIECQKIQGLKSCDSQTCLMQHTKSPTKISPAQTLQITVGHFKGWRPISPGFGSIHLGAGKWKIQGTYIWYISLYIYHISIYNYIHKFIHTHDMFQMA